MIIVGKSMPIDNYEQYKRVINQITGRIYIYTLETKNLFDLKKDLKTIGVCVVIYNNLLLIHLKSCVLKLVSELHDLI